MAKAFLGHSRAGIDFGQGVWKPHPKLKGLASDNYNEINEYILGYYKNNHQELENIRHKYQFKWDSVEKDFITKTLNLFNGYNFPKGDYIGYISIFNCNPRFLHNKTFQVYFKADGDVRTTAHELLHFIFYEYSAEKLPDLVQDLNTNNGLWWDVAEILNNVVLSSNEFRSVLEIDGDLPYLDHQKFLVEANKLWKERDGIDNFISDLFTLLKNKR